MQKFFLKNLQRYFILFLGEGKKRRNFKEYFENIIFSKWNIHN